MSDAGARRAARNGADVSPDVTAAGPLHGWRVMVARPAGRADELLAALRQAGADPRHEPLIEIRPEADSAELRRAVTDLAAGAYDWVAFTSAEAVTAVLATAGRAGIVTPLSGRTRVAAVGPATALALRTAGARVDLVPEDPGSGATLAAALLAALPTGPPGASVLLPRSARAADTLPDALRAAGHRVHAVPAYATAVLPVPGPLARDLAAGTLHAVLLTSPSTAQALAATPIADGTAVVAIGAPTAAAAARAGITVTATAARPTATELVRTLAALAADHLRH